MGNALAWAWVIVKFRVVRRAALLAVRFSEITACVQAGIERFSRSMKWRAMTAYSPIYVRSRQLAGCKKGCTREAFPHPEQPCYTHEDFDSDMAKRGIERG